MFETQKFLEECRGALKEANAHAAVKEIVTKAVAQLDE